MKHKITVRRAVAIMVVAAVTLFKAAQPAAAAPLSLSLGTALLKNTSNTCVTDANTIATDCEQTEQSLLFSTELASESATPVHNETDDRQVVTMSLPKEATETTPEAQKMDQNVALINDYIGEVSAETKPVEELKSIDSAQVITGLNPTRLFEMINAYRTTRSLPALQASEKVCKVAQDRAPELYREIFVTNNMHAGFYARQRPYKAVENMIHFSTEEGAVSWWLRSRVHHAAIISENYTHTCIACKGNSCAQIFAKIDA
ncbi:CAP domain-containing protein [Candidatus Woesebacteria bacterium]|nr:CAP domain-containing protein [Candidatus Woesebacteria bacterium]